MNMCVFVLTADLTCIQVDVVKESTERYYIQKIIFFCSCLLSFRISYISSVRIYFFSTHTHTHTCTIYQNTPFHRFDVRHFSWVNECIHIHTLFDPFCFALSSILMFMLIFNSMLCVSVCVCVVHRSSLFNSKYFFRSNIKISRFDMCLANICYCIILVNMCVLIMVCYSYSTMRSFLLFFPFSLSFTKTCSFRYMYSEV